MYVSYVCYNCVSNMYALGQLVLKDCRELIILQLAWDSTVGVVGHILHCFLPGKPRACPMSHHCCLPSFDLGCFLGHQVEFRARGKKETCCR